MYCIKSKIYIKNVKSQASEQVFKAIELNNQNT
jgi:hypothetical protein